MGTVIDAHFAGIQERFLPEKRMRPALAADPMRTPPEHPPKVVAPPMTSKIVDSEADDGYLVF